jgi:ABC-2 type transport system ATP-binding protein
VSQTWRGPDLPEAAIEAEGLSKKFGGEYAVQDATFVVPEGSIFGYIGPSGSGKTTTIRLLMGTQAPTAGRVRVLGRSPSSFGKTGRRRLGYMPQHFALYPDLSVWDNLNFASSLFGMGWRRKSRLLEVLDFVELSEHRRKRVSQISGGMQRRLSLAATLVHSPDLLFLDEPTAGVDPVLREKFWQRFRDLEAEGRTLFVTTQYVTEAEYCDLVGVMGQGRLLMVDTPENLRKRAFGGHQVDVRFSSDLAPEHAAELGRLPFVRDVRLSRGGEARLVVEDAQTALPGILDWSRERSLPLESLEEYRAPFDQVFVQLVRAGEEEDRRG